MKTRKTDKVRDLRDGMFDRAADPKIAEELESSKPLVSVEESHLATPGVGVHTPGQTTHE